MRPIVFERRVCAALRDACAAPAGSGIVLAVSGGPDSMALMVALEEQNRRDELGWRLQVAHLNHGLRGAESDADARFVERACRERGLAVTVEKISGGLGRASVEERARRARYEYLDRVANAAGARIVVTAHHADDQAETVLHHLVRGSGLRGMAGMRPARPIRRGSDVVLVRPLLGMTRAQILDYLDQRGQTYRTDASNMVTGRTRNRIRHRVLPMLEAELNPNARRALARFATVARWMDEFVGQVAHESMEKAIVKEADGQCVLDAEALAGEAAIVRLGVAMRVLQRLGVRERGLRFEHLCRMADLMQAGRARRRVELPARCVAVASRGRITIKSGAAAATGGAGRI